MNILHIISDEKFITSCQQTFSLEKVDNYYLKSGILTISYLEKNKIEVIIIHYLYDTEVDFFSRNSINIPIVWMFWGADGFSLPLFYNFFIDYKTLAYMKQWNFKHDFLLFVKDFFKYYGRKILNKSEHIKAKIKVINQFNYIIPIVPEDYNILIKTYPEIKTPTFHFNYITPVFFKNANNLPFVKGRNILVGNSASRTNNHIEIFSILNRIDLENRKVLIPLSYGDSNYRIAIEKYLIEKSSFKYKCIVEFLKFEEYQSIISSCEIMIMNHYRQQALGNIILALISGVTIYLNSKSSLFSFLVDHEFVVYEINMLFNKPLRILNKEEIKQNQSLAESLFGTERQRNSVRELLLEKLF